VPDKNQEQGSCGCLLLSKHSIIKNTEICVDIAMAVSAGDNNDLQNIIPKIN